MVSAKVSHLGVTLQARQVANPAVHRLPLVRQRPQRVAQMPEKRLERVELSGALATLPQCLVERAIHKAVVDRVQQQRKTTIPLGSRQPRRHLNNPTDISL